MPLLKCSREGSRTTNILKSNSTIREEEIPTTDITGDAKKVVMTLPIESAFSVGAIVLGWGGVSCVLFWFFCIMQRRS